MGVAGSGKTTVGRQLAAALDWNYFEADDFHPASNVAKMSRGEPLNDTDRVPWLAAIRAKIGERLSAGRTGVFTCSALKAAYRRTLMEGATGVALVHLQGDPDAISQRVGSREGHFMKAGLVRSQFEALEPPRDALTVDARMSPAEIVGAIRAHYAL